MILDFGVGTCGVLLGMKPVNVTQILGMPDKITVCDDDELYEQTYIYNKEMIMVWFGRDNLRVSLIQCFSPEMTVFGEKLFLREKEDVMALMASHGCVDFEETDTGMEETLFFTDVAAWFNFEFNKLTYVELGTFISGDGSGDVWAYGEE